MMNLSNTKSQKSKPGFTLVEVLVASSIFVILITLGMTSLGSFIHWKKRETANNALQEAGRHALEVISTEAQKANLSKARNEGGTYYYGFHFNDFGAELKLYTDPDPNGAVVFRKEGDKLKKDGQDLIPLNVQLIDLNFSGFEKSSTNLAANNFQQPYIKLKMTLAATSVDPSTGTSRSETADFQTTIRPQPLELMGYAEVQAGVSSPTGSSGNNARFDQPFSNKPIVVTARAKMNEDDDDSFVDNIFNDHFTYGDSTDGGDTYWIAVSGDFPGIIKSGQVNAETNHCSGGSGLCVPYSNPFSSMPVSLVTRTFPTNDEQYMNYTIRDSEATKRLKIAGDSWDGAKSKSPAAKTNFLWISFNSQIGEILDSDGVNFNLGNTEAKESYNGDGNFDCKKCTYSIPSPFPMVPPTSYTTYMCGFRKPSLQPPLPGSKVTFSNPFTSLPSPKAIISVASDGILDYSQVGHNINTPGIESIENNKFYYTNFGGGVPKIDQCSALSGPLFYSELQKNYVVRNYSINWVAMNQGFKLRWSYQ